MNEIEIPLGKEAIEWVRKTLTEGNTLSKYLLENINVDTGNVITFLPPEADIEKARTQFEWSVIPMSPRSEWVWLKETHNGKHPVAIPVHRTVEPQVEIISKFLEADSNRLCVFEDMMMSPKDPVFFKETNVVWLFNEEIYHIVFSSEKHTFEQIRSAISHAASAWPHFVGTITAFPDLSQTRPFRKQLTNLELKTIAQNTQKLIIGAYDNDGYLIWSK
jgi:hypothetical protein